MGLFGLRPIQTMFLCKKLRHSLVTARSVALGLGVVVGEREDVVAVGVAGMGVGVGVLVGEVEEVREVGEEGEEVTGSTIRAEANEGLGGRHECRKGRLG